MGMDLSGSIFLSRGVSPPNFERW